MKIRFHVAGVAFALSGVLIGAPARPASAQSSAPIQNQDLAPPPNTDPSRVLGAGSVPTGSAAPLPVAPPLPVSPGVTAPPIAAPTLWIPKTTARLMVLDKIYGTSGALTATVGTPFKVRFLTVSVLACWVRPDSLPPDAAVFLDVSDSRAPPGTPSEFRGWIFKAEPALSGLSDPVTDISVEECP